MSSIAAVPSSPDLERRSSTLQGIQYLRAIAALMVVAHHARHYFAAGDGWSTFGSRGVDIFFVISGFIMAFSTRSFRPDGNRFFQMRTFAVKRIVRVVPLYWLALLWTDKAEFLKGGADWSLLRDFLFVPHFHRVYTDSVFPSLVPGWTINYEMAFYALFALSMLFGRLRYVLVAAVLCGLVSSGGTTNDSAAASFYTSSVVIEFLMGIVVFFVWERWPEWGHRPTLWVICLTALVLLAVENGDPVRGWADGPFAALFVWSFVQGTRGWTNRWLRLLGDASYSIYLFHLASFWVPNKFFHWVKVEEPTAANVAIVLAVHIATAVVAGLAIHAVVERPLLGALRRWSSPASRPLVGVTTEA